MRRASIVAVIAAALGAPATAHAQFICANFWAQQSGTFGDQCEVTVTGDPTTPPPQGTAHGVTGFRLIAGGGFTYGYDSTTQVARFDIQVVGVDPGETVWFALDGAPYPVVASQLLMNPDVTTQPVFLTPAGRIRSAGPDGSVYLEIIAVGAVELAITVTGGAVVVYPVTNTFCQCGNGNKHFNEDCDDGNTADGDGCSTMCAIEPGWTCSGNPSVCTPPDASPTPDAAPDAEPDASVPDAPPDDDPDAGGPAGDDTGGGGGGCCRTGADTGPGTALIAIGLLGWWRRRVRSRSCAGSSSRR